MKRGFINSHHSSASLEDSSDVKRKYHILLQDYLELQKTLISNLLLLGFQAVLEYVSKKRKFQTAKQKREVLLDEVRFLKQRHDYLIINSQFARVESKLQNADINSIVNEKDDTVEKPRNCLINQNKGRKTKIVEKIPNNGNGNKSWSCESAGGSNSRTFKFQRRRCRRNPSGSHNNHDELLALLTMTLCSTYEVERPRTVELHLSVAIVVVFDRVGGVATTIIFLAYLQYRVFSTIVLPHCSTEINFSFGKQQKNGGK
ncbi:ribosomal RNA small subunit methyltransferase G [Senna tora]|uniref:Ribosomal RNA small subunit methyltransferase G n=1 Tax=Senna tora TaxID=362788 RepID=A0A834WHL6_9FABA|nr:ribosomal RNA small subunit methyltransferase G [Senna tora]